MIKPAITILRFALLFFMACISPAADPENIGHTYITVPLDYKNGVYYFPVQAAEFGNSLSHFIKWHPELEITSITSDDNGQRSHQGYFVICKRQPASGDFLL